MKRALLLAAPAVLALGLVACGDDDESPESTSADTTEETATEDTATEDTATDQTVTGGDLTMPTMPTIPDLTMPSLPSDFSIPSIPDFSLPSLPADATEAVESMLGQIFPNLDEEQLSCLTEAFSGGDFDISRAQQAAEDCGIDQADLVPGG